MLIECVFNQIQPFAAFTISQRQETILTASSQEQVKLK